MNKNFFAGLEELFARVASFLLVIIGFVIFILARNVNFILDWLGLVQVLSLFWLIYEVLGLIFFQAFHFFARQQIIPSAIPTANLDTNSHSLNQTTILKENQNLGEKIEKMNEKDKLQETKKPVLENVEVINTQE